MSRADERAEAIAEVTARLKNYSLSPCLDCGGQGYGDQGKSACFWCRGAGVITQQMAYAFGVADRASDEHPAGEDAKRLSGEAMPARSASADAPSDNPLTETKEGSEHA